MSKNKKTPIILGLISLIAIFAFAKREKVIQIFRNGEIIQEYTVDEIDYIEINDRLIVPEQIPEDEIWYVTSDGSVYDVTRITQEYGNQPFDRKVVSNEYYEDHGVIKFDGPVKSINDHTFGDRQAQKLTALYVPDCLEHIGIGAINGTSLTTFNVPQNIKAIGANGLNNPNIASFSGSHVSDDGRCVIIDGYLHAFAPKGLTSYTTPNDVKSIFYNAFSRSDELESITFNEGLVTIYGSAFSECRNLKTVTLPGTLKTLDSYAFTGCTSIEGFYGNENFHTPDNRCLITNVNTTGYPSGTWLINFAGKGLSEYAIPEGIVGIENYAFQEETDLVSVTLPESLGFVAGHAFQDCSNIESVKGYHTSSDNKCLVFNGELQAFVARKGITSYHIPAEITKIGDRAFAESDLEEISMSDNITEIGEYAFSWSYKLKSITLSASIKSFRGHSTILDDTNLETIYMRTPIPPSYSDSLTCDYPNLKIYVPEQTYDLYMNSAQWTDFKQYFVAHKYEDLDIDKYTPDYYYSTDFTQSGKVEQIYTATEGNGIDIILMGDGYSDRQIADGTYKQVMHDMANTLFEEEPYKSFKNLFNVYAVNVVSPTEGYDHVGTALGGYFGEGTHVGGNDAICFLYAQRAIPESRMDEALIVVAMNKNAYAGTCYMYYPSNATGTYGSGSAIAYFPTSSDTETFGGLIRHEALGHGFAKLGDEYAYEGAGAIPNELKSVASKHQTDWGWWKNIDFTSDLTQIRWSYFINDTRYNTENIGAYEGCFTYRHGVWRPTEFSIMRYNTGGFNAPSREAIYFRIHKLAYGDSWTYDYEKFVNYDSINRTEEAVNRAKLLKPRQQAPLHPPVVVKKNWRDAKTPEQKRPATTME